MNRRSFLAALVAAPVAPAVAKALPAATGGLFNPHADIAKMFVAPSFHRNAFALISPEIKMWPTPNEAQRALADLNAMIDRWQSERLELAEFTPPRAVSAEPASEAATPAIR